MKCRKPFFTGSRVYGTPTKDSDLDIVMRADPYMISAMRQIAPYWSGDYNRDSVSVMLGPVNLHLCSKNSQYDAWETATEILRVMGPVTRKKAIEVMNRAHTDWLGDNKATPSTYPPKKPAIRDDGRLIPYREWMGWDK